MATSIPVLSLIFLRNFTVEFPSLGIITPKPFPISITPALLGSLSKRSILYGICKLLMLIPLCRRNITTVGNKVLHLSLGGFPHLFPPTISSFHQPSRTRLMDAYLSNPRKGTYQLLEH
ncbi:118aa long hypothetical protein [Pyrococcus horikoshii OT3]|uniref:Uncharacterized protein n=1 Tax=Pyrococcus horikoshii (strain ATCC 700860 / DSM 12428 / JCM 9974 / NBRC 100139 / OT-3) TaxID=70601 RepID=O58208_PYRHO|nr:118aa long hypothetical protein [Pyrococcus horikoshii OT3]